MSFVEYNHMFDDDILSLSFFFLSHFQNIVARFTKYSCIYHTDSKTWLMCSDDILSCLRKSLRRSYNKENKMNLL